MKKNNQLLVLCVMIFILLSALLYFSAENKNAHFDLDSPGYDRIAQNFAHTNQLVDPKSPDIVPVQTMGYPLFLGSVYKLFGYHYRYLVIMQVLLALIAGGFLYLAALRLFGERVAKVAIGLFSINLGFLIYSQFFMTEILLSTLLIIALERLTKYVYTKDALALMSSFFVFGLSIVVKPVVFFYMPIVSLFILYSSKENLKRGFKVLMLSLLCFMVPVSGYMIHNKYQFGTFKIVPVMKELLYRYFLARLISEDKQIPFSEGFNEVNGFFEHTTRNDSEFGNKSHEVLFDYIRNKPFLVIQTWMINVIKTLTAPYVNQVKFLVNPSLKGTSTSLLEQSGSVFVKMRKYITYGVSSGWIHGLLLWEFFWHFIRFIFITFGFLALFKNQRYALILFFIVSILYFAGITGHDGCARYRMVFECMYILLAAVGIVSLYQCINNKNVNFLSGGV